MNNRIAFREGKQVYLRPREEKDIPALLRWFNDPEILQFLHRRDPLTEGDVRRQIQNPPPGRYTFVVMLKGQTPDKDAPIGWMSLFDIDHPSGTATTGAAIGEREYWSRGLGTEAKMLLLDFAFNTLHLRNSSRNLHR